MNIQKIFELLRAPLPADVILGWEYLKEAYPDDWASKAGENMMMSVWVSESMNSLVVSWWDAGTVHYKQISLKDYGY